MATQPNTPYSRLRTGPRMRPVLLGLAVCLPSAGAVGAESQFFGDVPIVLTASRLAQTPFEAPAPITVIDRETIEASGYTEIHDLLRLVPGFLVADWPSGSPTVVNHGLGDAYGRRLKVLIDGRTVNNPFRGNVDWQDLPIRIDDIERVEVVRGPHGAAYGANAFQGVVNIITRSPSTEAGNLAIGRAGNDGIQDVGIRVNGNTPGGLDWRATASQRRANNFDLLRADGALETIERNVANFQGVMQLTNQDQLRVFGGATVGYDRTGNPDSLSDPIRRNQIRENHLQVTWQRSFGPESEFSLQYAHQDRSERNKWDVLTPSLMLTADRDIDLVRDELEFQHSHRFNPQWHSLWGVSVRRDAVRSEYQLGDNGTAGGTQWQVFGSLDWKPVNALSLNLGGTFEDHYYGGSLFSPRFAANYSFSPFSVLRLSAGTAYRAPTVQEAESFQVTRQAGQIIDIGVWSLLPVESERVRFIELGYVGSLPDLGLTLDARLFREKYDRYLDEQRCRYQSSNPARLCAWPIPSWLHQNRDLGAVDTIFLTNAGSVKMDGAEFRLDWKQPGWGRAILTQSFVDVDQLEANSDPDMVSTAPTSMTSLLLMKELPERWNLSLGFQHIHRFFWLNDGDVVPSAGRTDLKLSKRFGPVGGEHELAFTVQSLEGRYVDLHEGKYRHQAFAFATLKLAW